MKRNIYQKISLYFVSSAIAIFLLIYAWDIFSGEDETWAHYKGNDPNTIIYEYSSIESCDKAMKQSQEQSGCRRIDGPYGLINTIADFLL
jgi:hypothetical protein